MELRVEVEVRPLAEDWAAEQVRAAEERDVRLEGDGMLVARDAQLEREDAQLAEAEP